MWSSHKSGPFQEKEFPNMWSSHKSGPFQEKEFPNIWSSHKGGPFQEVLYMLTEALALLLYRNLFLHTATRLWVWAGRPQPSTATLGRSAHLLQWGRQWYGLSPQVLPPTAAQLHMVVHMLCAFVCFTISLVSANFLSLCLTLCWSVCLSRALFACLFSLFPHSLLPASLCHPLNTSLFLSLSCSFSLPLFLLSLSHSICLSVCE